MSKRFVWDKIVRLVHWGVAVCVCVNWFLSEAGGTAHRIAGYAAAALVVVRLLWSLTGAQKPARFRDLIPTPADAAHHLRDLRDGRETAEPGHNAFGLAGIWAMWLCIAALAFTGYHAANYTALDERYGLDDWHGIFANILMVIAALHVLAVFLTGWRLKRNLLRPMIHK